MCIAIYKPEGAIIPQKTLVRCWDNNDDGAGFMYSDNGNLIVRKGFMNLNQFVTAYDSIPDLVNKTVVIHFRIRTHGTTTEKNTHPFVVFDNELAFVHNGILSDLPFDKYLSDTAVFNKRILQRMPKDFILNDGIMTMIQAFCGSSKLIFMNNKGDVWIVNEDLGETDDQGIWYSNSTYKFDSFTWIKDKFGGFGNYEIVDIEDEKDPYSGVLSMVPEFEEDLSGEFWCESCLCEFVGEDADYWWNTWPVCPGCGSHKTMELADAIQSDTYASREIEQANMPWDERG